MNLQAYSENEAGSVRSMEAKMGTSKEREGYFFSWLLCIKLEMGVFGVWAAMTIDWLVRAVCFAARYLRGRWMNKVA